MIVNVAGPASQGAPTLLAPAKAICSYVNAGGTIGKSMVSKGGSCRPVFTVAIRKRDIAHSWNGSTSNPRPAATAKPKRPASQTPLLPSDTAAIRAPRLRIPGTSVHGEATS
jgi:hypothetical protein